MYPAWVLMVRGRPKTHVPALMEPTTWNRETDKTGIYFEVYTQTHTQLYNEKNGMKVMNRMQSSGTHETGKESYLEMVVREDILEKIIFF